MDFYRRNELPETVKRYKNYTDQFQEWLMRTAVQRNVERATQIWEQANNAKGKKPYKISIKQQELLVDGLTKTDGPLEDTSGFQDLGDAIRSRKEVTQYYRATKTSDVGHTYFDGVLEGFKAALRNLIMPALYTAHEVEDEFSNFVFIQFAKEDSGKKDEEISADEAQEPEDHRLRGKSWTSAQSFPKKKSNSNSLTKEEQTLQQDLQVLCFLYEFNRIRDIIREVWVLYRNGIITAITAALVTDLVQGHIQQNVAALVEDLGAAPGRLLEIVEELYEKMVSTLVPSHKASNTPQLSEQALHQLLCISAIKNIEAYLAARGAHVKGSGEGPRKEHPFMAFLQFFDIIRKSKIKLPIWDKFTEDILLRADASQDWLVFGFQIVLDIQEVVRDNFRTLFKDITEHGLDISKLIRTHVDYEDFMWAVGKRPDYLSREATKFSTVFLNPLNTLLAWLQNLLKTDHAPDAESKLTTDVFVTVHSTLAGLTMWHFNKTYHSTAIAKVQWFIICLSHLYNAARQIGGLDIVWPDLEFIIKMHGSHRIFLGNPPTNPKDFLDRYWLACCVSTRFMARDYRGTGKFAPTAPREVREKRGLMSHFPLEEKIKTYYGPNPKNDRWLKRHAIFNYLHQLKETSDGSSMKESEEAHKRLKELQDTFTSMAAKISPPKSKKRSKTPSRVRSPEFSEIDDGHARLFPAMLNELRAHELHSNFDYLSFYRRAFELLLKIRDEVLFDSDIQIARRADVRKSPNPANQVLLVELFSALKIKPKDPKAQTTGDEVSKDVEPVEQMQRIATLMGDAIRKKGSEELGRAKMRLKRDWDGLKASYTAEEAEQQQPEPGAEEVPHANDQHSDSQGAEPNADGEGADVDHRRSDIDMDEAHCEVTCSQRDNDMELEDTGNEDNDRPLLISDPGPDVDVYMDVDNEADPDGAAEPVFSELPDADEDQDDWEHDDTGHEQPGNNGLDFMDDWDLNSRFGSTFEDESVLDDFEPEPRPNEADPMALDDVTEELELQQGHQPRLQVLLQPLQPPESIPGPSTVTNVKKAVEDVVQSAVKKPFQAYVSNEADEAIGWAADPEDFLDAVQHEDQSDYMEDTLKALDAVNQDDALNGPGPGEEQRIGGTVSAEDDDHDFSVEDVEGHPVQEVAQDFDAEAAEQKRILTDIDRMFPSDDVKSGESKAKRPDFTDIFVRQSAVRAADKDDLSDTPVPPKITPTRLHKELSPETEETPKHNGNPRGVFHRLTFSSTASRKPSVVLKRSTARLTLSRKRSATNKHNTTTSQPTPSPPRKKTRCRLAGTAKKHSVSMPCYALCCMARALLGKETKFQRRIKEAVKTLRATHRRDSLDLEKAWILASAGERRDVDEGLWESDAELN